VNLYSNAGITESSPEMRTTSILGVDLWNNRMRKDGRIPDSDGNSARTFSYLEYVCA